MPYKNLIIYDAAPFLEEYQWRTVRMVRFSLEEYQWRTVRMTWLMATAKIHGIYGIARRLMWYRG